MLRHNPRILHVERRAAPITPRTSGLAGETAVGVVTRISRHFEAGHLNRFTPPRTSGLAVDLAVRIPGRGHCRGTDKSARLRSITARCSAEFDVARRSCRGAVRRKQPGTINPCGIAAMAELAMVISLLAQSGQHLQRQTPIARWGLQDFAFLSSSAKEFRSRLCRLLSPNVRPKP